jgi:hypothetical protein
MISQSAFSTFMIGNVMAHTAAYSAGFNQGKLDRQNNTPKPAMDVCDSSDFTGIDHDHCVVGYLDGLNGR